MSSAKLPALPWPEMGDAFGRFWVLGLEKFTGKIMRQNGYTGYLRVHGVG